MSIQVTLNGEPKALPGALTVRALLRELGLEQGAVAVAINSEFVPRSAHQRHLLADGDRIELVAPMQGG